MRSKLFFCKFLAIVLVFFGCSSGINRAVYNNDFDKLESMLKSGIDINTRDEVQRTPLIYAAYVSNNSMLKYLIKKGANLNDVDYKGCTALIYAGYYGLHQDAAAGNRVLRYSRGNQAGARFAQVDCKPEEIQIAGAAGFGDAAGWGGCGTSWPDDAEYAA